MIAADRFLVQSSDRDEWLDARRQGVTATEVSLAATPAGFALAAEARRYPADGEDNAFMAFGREAEPELMRYAHRRLGILPNSWLIAAELQRAHMATPDGLSLDHKLIAECKTTGKPWTTAPIKYRRQIAWQCYVTGAERCALVWNLRVDDGHGWFYLGYMEPRVEWIDRDDAMITDLIATADRLLGTERQAA